MSRSSRLLAVLVLLLASCGRSLAGEARVLIVSIDGLRPDVALRADMPNLRGLMNRGSFTFLATTTPAAITLPSHTSMLTGVTIERHGISGNDDTAAVDEKLLVPTIFDLAKAAGISTGMASGKSKFSLYDPPIDHTWHPPNKMLANHGNNQSASDSAGSVVKDDLTADHAVQIIRQFTPRLMFVHFGYNDDIGHAIGWGSTAQVEGLSATDAALGRVLDAIKSAGLLDDTVVIVTADHGGSGRLHGAKIEGSKYIPWIIAGPGIRRNVDLSLFRDWPVRTYDTFATACGVLGIKTPPDIDGRSVAPAFAATELLVTTTRPVGTAHGSTTTPATKP